MADIASIIANIDGYRTYEQNRSLDLQNQAAQMANAQNKEIWDLKKALAEQTPSLFEKWAYFDPQAARQKQFSDEQQLKMASTWANSIKNLAPENRAQGYNQFLRKMRAYGIDVSDMPQAYDEGFINQVAELGIEPETRYTNEQANMRQERQIQAQREARQDEFEKRLQEFDYENNYRTSEEKRKLQEKDNFVKALGYDDDTTNSLLAANRGITTPATDEIMLSRLNKNPQDVGARTYFANKAEASQYIKALTPKNDVSFKDAMNGLKYAADSGATVESLNTTAKELGYPELQFENLDDFDKKAKAYEKSKAMFPDLPEAEHRKNAGLSTYQDEALGAGLKSKSEAEGELPSLIKRDDNQSQNRINENNISQYIADKIKQGQMILQSDIDKAFESYKKTLPTDSVIEAHQQAQVLQGQGFNVTAADILKNKYQAEVLDNLAKQAQTAQAQANTQKTLAETADIGNTTDIKNAKFIAENPEMANSPVFNKQKQDKGETELRKEFNAITKDYRTIGDSYSRILKAAEKPSAAGDLSLIFNYMKMLDPNSVVRESEFSNAENARAWFAENGVPTFVQLSYNKAIKGQKLTQNQRNDFVSMAGNLMKAQQASFNALSDQYRKIAEDNGYNPERVVFDPYSGIEEPTIQEQTETQGITPEFYTDEGEPVYDYTTIKKRKG